MGLRLPVGGVTVLLGPPGARAATMAALDEGSGRCGAGHRELPVVRLSAPRDQGLQAGLDAVEAARTGSATIVLVDRLTGGLDGGDRRRVLTALRHLAAPGRAVLVDDDDPVAALAVADGVLRAGGPGGPSILPVSELDALDDLAS